MRICKEDLDIADLETVLNFFMYYFFLSFFDGFELSFRIN